MNKAQLVEAIASGAGISLKDANEALNALTETVTSEVKKGNKVTLPGFGTWARVRHAARTGRNPRTGQQIKIAAKNAPKFTPGATFKDTVAGKAPAKAAAKKAAPKKAAPKKAAAKKAAPKKAAAKKAAPKKAAAKKTAKKR